MHQSSYGYMQKFVAEYGVADAKVLDVGSLNINGTYRDLFTGEYTGLDLLKGDNVDLVGWSKAKTYEVVICGQTLEHCEDDAGLVKKIAKALVPGGLCCLIAPSAGPVHSEPDYRRYTPETLSELVTSAGLEVLETRLGEYSPWFDVVVIARKNDN